MRQITFNSNVRVNSKLYPTFRYNSFFKDKKIILRNVRCNLLFNITLLLNIIWRAYLGVFNNKFCQSKVREVKMAPMCLFRGDASFDMQQHLV